ncbi:MAG TPA: 50S ribosomal protein L30 [Gammaproteobacteria bacterium]|nr:50S ribosomal protein L30 [Gammaproteobacteria bacterium]
MSKQVKVKLIKSMIGRNKSQIATVRGLGLRKIGDVATLDATPAIMGMIFKIKFMLNCEEVSHAVK